MLILSFFLLILFIINIKSFLNSVEQEKPLLDEIGKKILNYANEKHIPLILTDKLIGHEAGSMSSTYNGYLNMNNHSKISVIIKYSSFKTTWNYIHWTNIDNLYENGCYSNINENTNEYLISKQERNRILNESWIPSEVYVAFKGYVCQHLMPTSMITDPNYSYFSFFNSIEQNDDERTFFIIFKKLENGISLKNYLEKYSNKLTIEIVKYLIYSILTGIIKLKQMSIIHMDLNAGNIFLMNNDHQHPIRFIDFAIIKFIHKSSQLNVMYSESLHQSLRSIFHNCPSCFHQNYLIENLIFPQNFYEVFKTYSIEEILNHPWFYTNTFSI